MKFKKGPPVLIWNHRLQVTLFSSSGVMTAPVKIVVRTSKDKEPTGATATGPWTEATNSGDHSLTGLTGVRDDIDLPCWIQQPVSPN
jgi:hypothetical protein